MCAPTAAEGDAAGGASGGVAGAAAVARSEVFGYAALVEHLRDPEEQRLLRALMETFEALEELTEEEDGRGLYHDTRVLLRYLRVRNWNLQAAENTLRNTGRWRKSFDVAGLVAGEYGGLIAQHNEAGKLYVRGCDKHGRPAIYMRPRNEVGTDYCAMIRHMVYCIERAVSCVDRRACGNSLEFEANDPHAGKFVFCLDFGGYSLLNVIPLTVARDAVAILQDHYPDRLGQAFIVDAPWIFDAFVQAVSPFVRPKTLEKMEFLREEGEERARRMAEIFEPSELEPAFGGTAAAPFESRTFLNCKREGTEFGLEFNEQLALADAEPRKAEAKVESNRARRDAARRRLSGSRGFAEDVHFRLEAADNPHDVAQSKVEA